MPLFGTSGVRGVFGQDLTLDLCREVAQGLGSILPLGSRVCVATDTRVSREAVKDAVFSGLRSCGIEVTDLGILPTPALACLTREWGFDTGVMITASHNPPEFNGIKLFNGDSKGYSRVQEEQIERVYRDRAFRGGGSGSVRQAQGMMDAYLGFLKDRISVRDLGKDLRIVVDPGNGAASGFASSVFAAMGLDVIAINDTPDGTFPGRNPEPKEDTLQGTVEFLREKEADLAVCFDGDADRVVFCDRHGFLGFNEPTAFISRLVARDSGKSKVASTVEAGRLLELAVADLGVEVVRGRVGDVDLAYLTQQSDAAIGTEQVGVYIIPEAGFYPDSLYATLVLLSRIERVAEIRDFFKDMPGLFFDKGKVSCPNELKQAVMKQVEAKANLFGASNVNNLDGVRLEFGESWMLIRASGTEPAVRVIAESTLSSVTQELLERGVETVKAIVEEGA